eukprot:scaffold20528_cov54-Phaeocystis_antarctica.AAC.4
MSSCSVGSATAPKRAPRSGGAWQRAAAPAGWSSARVPGAKAAAAVYGEQRAARGGATSRCHGAELDLLHIVVGEAAATAAEEHAVHTHLESHAGPVGAVAGWGILVDATGRREVAGGRRGAVQRAAAVGQGSVWEPPPRRG